MVEQPKPTPLNRTERLQVGRYRAFRDRVHEGPLYTILGDSHRVGKQGGSGTALVNPFEGMPTYSQKYRKKTRKLPRLDTRPYGRGASVLLSDEKNIYLGCEKLTMCMCGSVMEFFPKELWSTLDPEYEKQNPHETATATARNKKKILKLSRPDVDKDFLNEDDIDDTEEQERAPQQSKAGLKAGEEDEYEQGKAPDDELEDKEGEEDDEEEQDDDFEDVEDEMGEDYNAEGYFEDGRDDDMEDYGDGGVGGDDDGGLY